MADTVLVTTARWTIEQVVDAVDDLTPDALDPNVHRRIDVARSMLEREPLASSNAVAPARPDLAALRASGRPWASVAAVADWMLAVDHDPARLTSLPIDPDPVLMERLFHVAVVGCLLRALRAGGWTIEVVGLPGDERTGPILSVTDPALTTWDVWFEMAGAWNHYGVSAPYPPAVVGISGTGRPLGADIALVALGRAAVVVECKFSADPVYVGRNGYEQALAYMAEVRTGIAPRAVGIVVGPDEVVTASGRTVTSVGPVHVTNPTSFPNILVSEAEQLASRSVVA